MGQKGSDAHGRTSKTSIFCTAHENSAVKDDVPPLDDSLRWRARRSAGEILCPFRLNIYQRFVAPWPSISADSTWDTFGDTAIPPKAMRAEWTKPTAMPNSHTKQKYPDKAFGYFVAIKRRSGLEPDRFNKFTLFQILFSVIEKTLKRNATSRFPWRRQSSAPRRSGPEDCPQWVIHLQYYPPMSRPSAPGDHTGNKAA